MVLCSLWGPCWYSTWWWNTCPQHLPGQAAWSAPCSPTPYPTPALGSWPHILKNLGATGTPVALQAQHRALHFRSPGQPSMVGTPALAPHILHGGHSPGALWAAAGPSRPPVPSSLSGPQRPCPSCPAHTVGQPHGKHPGYPYPLLGCALQPLVNQATYGQPTLLKAAPALSSLAQKVCV